MQSHKRRRCEEDDGDFDFNRPPSRQRSESLFRRQQELFNAMNMDFNGNDKQQEEDQNFDLELPFDVQGSDVNNDGDNAPFDNIVSYLSFKFGDLFTQFMEKHGSKWFTIVGIIIVIIGIIIYLIS